MDVQTLIRAIAALDPEDMLEVMASIRDNIVAANLSSAENERVNQRFRAFDAERKWPPREAV